PPTGATTPPTVRYAVTGRPPHRSRTAAAPRQRATARSGPFFRGRGAPHLRQVRDVLGLLRPDEYADLTARYRNTGRADLTVNGGTSTRVNIASTLHWNQFNDYTVPVTHTKGANTVLRGGATAFPGAEGVDGGRLVGTFSAWPCCAGEGRVSAPGAAFPPRCGCRRRPA
ncbi:hypothetical protein FNH08_40075, partial [Streptomyces spongiae]|nr:hypothetical protein [Streptomyces spongiae]